MRYVLAVTGAFFLLGLLTGFLPVEVLIMLSVFALLGGSALVGARSRNRVRSLQQAVFITDTLIGFRGTAPDEDPDSNVGG
jgi:hypothetical protein